MSEWSVSTHARIGTAIKNARGKRSAQWLADRTLAMGYPMTRAQIANYESGRKQSLDVTDLVVIAAALDVPPIALLYPELPDGMVEVVPGESISSIEAVRRFTDEAGSGGSDGARLLSKSREIFEARRTHKLLDDHVTKVIERTRIAKGANESQEEYISKTLGEVISTGDKLSQLTADLARIPGAVLRDHA